MISCHECLTAYSITILIFDECKNTAFGDCYLCFHPAKKKKKNTCKFGWDLSFVSVITEFNCSDCFQSLTLIKIKDVFVIIRTFKEVNNILD